MGKMILRIFIDRGMKWVFLILVSMNMWIYSDFAFSENVGFPNLQSSGELPISQNTQQEFCDSLFPSLKDLKELCQILELKNLTDLPDFAKQSNEDLFNFAGVAQGHINIFTNPEVFKKFTTNPDLLVRMLGFDKVSQLEKVEPGPTLVVKDVPLNGLAEFNPEIASQKITHEGEKLAVPLYLREDSMKRQGRSMLIFGLSKEHNKWVLIQRGISRRYQRMFKYRTNENLMIDIPGLNIRFLAENERGELQLIPLEDAKFQGVTLKAGVKQSAKKIFAGLAPEAEKIIEEDRKIPTQNIPGNPPGRKPVR